MNIWGKSVLGNGNSKDKDMEAEMCLGWLKNSKEGDMAAKEKVKRMVDGGQRGNARSDHIVL